MSNETIWNTIREAAEDAGLEDIREDYSGRFMYGGRCCGIVGTADELFSVLLEAQVILTRNYTGDLRIPTPTKDSMGRDEIWYWPSIAPPVAVEKIRCWCGSTVKEGMVHYPGGDPENGPAHLPTTAA